MQTDAVKRVLIVYPDEAMRQALGDLVRRSGGSGVFVHETASVAEAMEQARRLEPAVIFIDLDESRGVALDAARSLRRSDRLIVGLYNPLTLGAGESRLLRDATRAGFGDFIAVPPAASEVNAALESSAALSSAREQEGCVMAFFSHKGGVGTSTLAAATAIAIKASGAGDVVLAELKPTFGDLAGILGLHPERDLASLAADLDQPGPIESYCLRDVRSGIAVLPGPADPADGARLTPGQVERAIIALRRRFPWVVLDVPAQLDLLALGALDLSEKVCVVTEAATATLQQTAALLRVLDAQGFHADRIKVIVNRNDFVHSGPHAREITEAIGRKAEASLGFDLHVAEAAESGGLPTLMNSPKAEFVRTVGLLARSLTQGGLGKAGG